MDKDKEFEAYHRGYDQGRFDEYADQTGYNKAKLIKNRIEKQTNCPYCHGICRAILEAPDFKLNVGCKDLICDFKKTGGWINPPINYCPMCGRPLGGNEDG